MLFNLRDKKGEGFPKRLIPFDASTAANNVAVFDGDSGLDSTQWRDTGGSNIITFFNAPTFNAAGLNGHGTIQFNGTTQFGNSTTPTINQPYTFYLVLKQITWIATKVFFDDGVNLQSGVLYQIGSSPIIAYSDIIEVISTSNLALNTWGIVTIVVNGINSKLRINLLNASTGDINNNKNGINLASNTGGGSNFCNCEFAYIIMRNVADPLWLQNNFINWLKNRFAI